MNRSDYNLAQWLEWMEKNHPTEIDLGLARVSRVLARMELDLSASRIISIAGTNGKGTTTAFLESIYLANGYSTLAYTSPHMLYYNERVRLNGHNVEDTYLTTAFTKIDQAMGQGSERISLSYFEIGTLAAIYLVSQEKPDVALLEVGLGGRLDAVNIVDADVAVITTLAIDHVDWLGDDIEQIGREKAGIARANKPLICGELTPPKSIKELSQTENFKLLQVNDAFSYTVDENNQHWTWQGRDISGQSCTIEHLQMTHLPVQNAATALQVIHQLDLTCSTENIRLGLSQAQALGRLQKVNYQDTQLLLDVAHNPQSAKYLADALYASASLENDQPYRPHIQLVLGVLADKDCQGLITQLQKVVKHWHLVTLDVPRGQKSTDLQQIALEQGVASEVTTCHSTIQSALQAAKTSQKNDETIVVAGSFFTVTAVLELIATQH